MTAWCQCLPAGLRQFVLEDAASVRLTDPVLNGQLESALVAIAETAFPAEDSDILGFERVGKPAWQQDWLRFCLEESARHNARFVVWMMPRDIDDLFVRVPPILHEFLKFIRDTGLLDGQGKPRKSFETWSQWLKIPRAK